MAMVFVVLKEGAVLFEPYIYKEIIEVFERFYNGVMTRDETIRRSIVLVLGFISAQGVVIVANTLMLRTVNKLDASIMRDAANDFVAKVLNLSFRFHSDRKTGKMAKEFARGVNAIEIFLDATTFNLLPLTIRLSVIFVVFFVVDWPLALVLFVMVATFYSFTIVSSIYMQKRRMKANKLDDESSHKAMDALMNAEVVKYFQQEHDEIQSFKKVRQEWKKTKQNEWDGWTWISSALIGINIISVTTILSIVILRLLSGDLGLSDFVMVITYLTLMVGLLWDFQHFFREIHEAFTDLTAFFHYYDQENEIKDDVSSESLNVEKGEIRFEHVTFGYNDENKKGKTVLRDVSFTVPAGASVAFVGPSGVGKSTIIKLLYRFYDPRQGRILIDGQDVSQVKQQSLREALGIVPQETALFNDTVAYNIAYGQKTVDMDAVREAAQLAHVDQFISRLPQGYETIVGERGVKLSGGEKQRISIVRAFMRDAPILILDEATSSLDSAAEHEIQVALQGLMKGRTTLIIAHRLSTIMNADLIIVLNDGGIEQQGTHDELLKHGGLYNKLWELQAGGYIE